MNKFIFRIYFIERSLDIDILDKILVAIKGFKNPL